MGENRGRSVATRIPPVSRPMHLEDGRLVFPSMGDCACVQIEKWMFTPILLLVIWFPSRHASLWDHDCDLLIGRRIVRVSRKCPSREPLKRSILFHSLNDWFVISKFEHRLKIPDRATELSNASEMFLENRLKQLRWTLGVVRRYGQLWIHESGHWINSVAYIFASHHSEWTFPRSYKSFTIRCLPCSTFGQQLCGRAVEDLSHDFQVLV